MIDHSKLKTQKDGGTYNESSNKYENLHSIMNKIFIRAMIITRRVATASTHLELLTTLFYVHVTCPMRSALCSWGKR